MKWAISSLSFPDILQKKIEAAAEAGFSGIEIFHEDLIYCGVKAGRIGKFARSLGIEVLSLQSLRDYEGAPESQRAWNRKRSERYLDLAEELGARLLIVCSNGRADTMADEAAAVRDLVDLADRAAKRGLSIGYEALSSGAVTRTYVQAAALVERANRPNLGLVISTAHTVFAGADLAGIAALDVSRIALIHMADVPNVRMDARLLSGNYRLFPGQGDQKLHEVYAALKAKGYAGPISLEIFNGQMRGMSPAQIATDGIRAFNLLEEIDEASRRAIRDVAFVEIACFDEEKDRLLHVLECLGFVRTHLHKSKKVSLWRNGKASIVINEEHDSHAHAFHLLHGLSVCAVAYHVEDMAGWLKRMHDYHGGKIEMLARAGEMNIPAVRGIEGSMIFFIDAKAEKPFHEVDFNAIAARRPARPVTLAGIDHFSQAVLPAEFFMGLLYYRALMGFEPGSEVGVLDPHGAVQSRNMKSANGQVRMAINASYGANSTTQRFLANRMGAGYQHFAFGCDDIFAIARDVDPEVVLKVPPTYYDVLNVRFDLDKGLIEKMRQFNILYDEDAGGRFFHFYSVEINGLFFEVVQRDGYAGFGAVNAPVRMAAQTRDFEEEQSLLTDLVAL